MTRVLSGTRLHSSDMLRFLTRQGLVDASTDTGDVGQRLGDWLDFRQAIALQAFIGSVEAPPALETRPSARVDAALLQRRFADVRAGLEQSILQGTVPAPGWVRIDTPATELDHPIDPKTAVDPFRRYFIGHQRQMDHIIRSLRSQLRRMLDKGTAQHKQLSTLDAIFENVLSAREARLLGHFPAEFEKRFTKALKQHMKQLVQAAEVDEPAPRTTPWLGPLREDLRTALLAELDLRLQPVLGLIEALTLEKSQQQ